MQKKYNFKVIEMFDEKDEKCGNLKKLKEIKKVKIKMLAYFNVFVILLSALFFSGCNKNYECSNPLNVATVVLDAGHGGIDGGVSGVKTNTRESEINLAICFFLKDYLSLKGINVVMTRKNSAGLYGLPVKGHKKRDMKRRKEIINSCSPSLVVSIHQNKFSSPAKRGSQLYIKKGDDGAMKLCKILKEKLSYSYAKCTVLYGDYYILNNSPCPSVIVECGFLSNEKDEKLLIDKDYQKLTAEKIGSAIMEYVALKA